MTNLLDLLTRPARHATTLAACLLVASGTHANASSSMNVRQFAAELGISPEAVVVSGVAAHDTAFVATILSRLADADDAVAAMASLGQQLSDLGGQMTAAQAALRLQPHDTEAVDAVLALELDIAAARSQLETYRDQVLDEVLEGLPSAVVERFHAWKTSSTYAVPPAFRVAARTREEWKAIEQSLRAEMRAQRMSIPLAEHHEQRLQAVRAEAAVVQASYDLAALLASVNSAFSSFGTE